MKKPQKIPEEANFRGLDQFFLGQFRAEVTAREKALGADDGKGCVMFHARGIINR